ncbi:MAG: LPS-assembly protein LptD [Nitrospinota bacterium]
MRAFVLLLLAPCLLAATPAPGRAQAPSPGRPRIPGRLPEILRFFQEPEAAIAISADTLREDRKRKLVIGEGSVDLRFLGQRLQADRVEVNTETRDGVAEGNVVFSTPNDRLLADRMTFNLDTQRGEFFNARGYVGAFYYVQGRRIRRISEDKFEVERGIITSCAGDSPDWSFAATSALIHIENYAYIWNPSFWVKEVPVAYLPYLIVPIKTKRATGFLIPQFGRKSKDGLFIKPRFFWAVTDWADFTLGADLMEERGVRWVGEARYKLSEKTEGEVRASFLRDMILGGDFWKVEGRHRQEFGPGTRLDMVADFVNRTRFDRELEEELLLRTRRNTDSHFTFTRTFGARTLRLTGRRQEGLQESGDQVLERFPELSFEVAQEVIPSTPLRWSLTSTYAGLRKREGELNVSLDRLDIEPRLSLPLTPRPWISLTPEVGVRETYWTKQRARKGSNEVRDVGLSRESWDAKITAEGPKVAGVFLFELGPLQGFKHLITPSLTYTYRPAMDSEDRRFIIPIDGVDSIEDANTLTYALTNRFLGKIRVEDRFQTRELLRVKLSQSYDVAEVRRTQPLSREDPGTRGKRRPFGPIDFEALSRPFPWAEVSARANYDVYDEEIRDYTLNLELRGGKFWYLKAQRQWARAIKDEPARDDVNLGGGFSLFKKWFFEYFTRINREEHVVLERTGRVHYQGCCWGVGLTVQDLEDDTRIFLTFNLVGVLEGERVPQLRFRRTEPGEEGLFGLPIAP